MGQRRLGFWFYAGLISILVISFVYYQGLTADANVVLPFVLKGAELAQGRNPANGNFSDYPKQP